jgi:hypothetical protein
VRCENVTHLVDYMGPTSDWRWVMISQLSP